MKNDSTTPLVLFSASGGVVPEKLGRDVWPSCKNPYPIYEQNLGFSLPYWLPDQKCETLFITWPLHSYRKHHLCKGFIAGFIYRAQQAFNRGEERKSRMEEGGHDKEVASSKLNTSIQKSTPYLWQNGGRMAKIDTLFMTKTAKTLPFWAAYTYIAHTREYPPGFSAKNGSKKHLIFEKWQLLESGQNWSPCKSYSLCKKLSVWIKN